MCRKSYRLPCDPTKPVYFTYKGEIVTGKIENVTWSNSESGFFIMVIYNNEVLYFNEADINTCLFFSQKEAKRELIL